MYHSNPVISLDYGKQVVTSLDDDPLLSDTILGRLTYFSSTTREQYSQMGRITSLLSTGEFFRRLEIENLEPENDRAMICGSLSMIKDTSEILETAGLREGANSNPKEFVIEKAFAEQ